MFPVKGSWKAVAPAFLLLVLTSISPQGALADGMVIPMRAYAIPTIPDQQALIHFDGKVETLVIETSFSGQGTNFAWIVPLPAPPKIEPVSTGLFRTLQVIFQPEIVLSVRHYWPALPIAAMLVGLIALIRRESFFGLTIAAIIFLLMAAIFPPSLSKARTAGLSGGASANVQVLSRENAGLFETVTIQAKDSSALLEWLNGNGFATPKEIEPAVADYVRRGWVFASAKLRCEPGENAIRSTHPLAFSFLTTAPVYPLRLTATGNTPCRVDLYVFGPRRASVPGFTVQRCEAPQYKMKPERYRLLPGALQVRHRELSRLVANAPVATKLSAVLSPAEMNRDAYLKWVYYRHSGSKAYTPGAALVLSANVAALLFLGLAAVWWALSNSRWARQFHPARWAYWLATASLTVGLVVYAVGLTKTDMKSFRVRPLYYGLANSQAFGLAVEIGDELNRTKMVSRPAVPGSFLTALELERLRQSLFRDSQGHLIPKDHLDDCFKNFFTGQPIRFEASPGNVILRPVTKSQGDRDHPGSGSPLYELVWHDLDGAEAVTNEVPVGR